MEFISKESFDEIITRLANEIGIDPRKITSLDIILKHEGIRHEMEANMPDILSNENNRYHYDMMAVMSLLVMEKETYDVARPIIGRKFANVIKFLNGMNEDCMVVDNILSKNIFLFFKNGIKSQSLYKNIYREIIGNNVTYGSKDVMIQLFPNTPDKLIEIGNLIMKSN